MTSTDYRPEIDGLRAVAVIGVILFHLGYSWIPGGFIGVDVFFVISGFLISSNILKDLQKGSFSFRDFWARRIRRILPAMLTVTASTLAVTYFFVFRPEQQQIGRQALASLFSVANIYLWRTTDSYWGSESEESPFLHMWSLSVEEQFYLFLPLAMWLVFRLCRHWLQEVLLVAVLISLGVFLWALDTYPTATFYLLPTRMWELGAGCLLATATIDKRTDQFSSIFATAGLGLIILAFVFVPKLNGTLGLAVIGTALILACGHHGFPQKLLSHWLLRHIGKLSYSLYLWHWPILVLARPLGYDWKDGSGKAIAIIATYVLSLTSYHLVERPTRHRTGIVVPIFGGGLLVGLAAFWMASTQRFYTVHDGLASPVNKYSDYNIHPDGGWGLKYKDGGIITIRGQSVPQLVVLGDSHAVWSADVIDDIAAKHNLSTSIYAMSGLDPFCKIPPVAEQRRGIPLQPDTQLDVDQSLLRHLNEWRPPVVLISCRWGVIDEAQSLALLKWLADQNIRVLLLEDPPYLDMPEDENAMKTAIYAGMKYNGVRQYWPVKHFDTNNVARNLAREYKHVDIIPIYDTYLDGPQAMLFNGHQCVYWDNDHLTTEGYKLAASKLEESILRALNALQVEEE